VLGVKWYEWGAKALQAVRLRDFARLHRVSEADNPSEELARHKGRDEKERTKSRELKGPQKRRRWEPERRRPPGLGSQAGGHRGYQDNSSALIEQRKKRPERFKLVTDDARRLKPKNQIRANSETHQPR